MDLTEFLKQYPKAAVAFSGGVDSAYLLYAAIRSGINVRAYYVKSDFQPEFELDDALRLSIQLKADMKIIPVDILSSKSVAENPCDRCYHCKRAIFKAILEAALQDGFPVLFDGTNASDDQGDRPGMRALQELKVLSPLRECGLTKEMIRLQSHKAGLFTWNKPAYACLATRIPTGEIITKEKLSATEAAEDYLFSLGFSDFRVRRLGTAAKIQLPSAQLSKLLEHREKILKELKKYYTSVLLDMEVRE